MHVTGHDPESLGSTPHSHNELSWLINTHQTKTNYLCDKRTFIIKKNTATQQVKRFTSIVELAGLLPLSQKPDNAKCIEPNYSFYCTNQIFGISTRMNITDDSATCVGVNEAS
jgi:hypothetical protein